MKIRIAMCTAPLAFALAGESAWAQDYPETRLLHGLTGEESVLLECAPTAKAKIECTVTQTLVRHIPRRREVYEIDAILATAERDSETCTRASAMKAALVAGVQPADPELVGFTERLKAMPGGQIADIHANLDATITLCSNPSRSTAEALLRVEEDKQDRSCRVSSDRFKEVFTTIDDGTSWISQAGPTGICGVITISKIQRDTNSDRVWTYSSERTVTKRDEMLGDLLSCRAIDEKVHGYRQGGGATYLNCDYITFEYSPTLP